MLKANRDGDLIVNRDGMGGGGEWMAEKWRNGVKWGKWGR